MVQAKEKRKEGIKLAMTWRPSEQIEEKAKKNAIAKGFSSVNEYLNSLVEGDINVVVLSEDQVKEIEKKILDHEKRLKKLEGK